MFAHAHRYMYIYIHIIIILYTLSPYNICSVHAVTLVFNLMMRYKASSGASSFAIDRLKRACMESNAGDDQETRKREFLSKNARPNSRWNEAALRKVSVTSFIVSSFHLLSLADFDWQMVRVSRISKASADQRAGRVRDSIDLCGKEVSSSMPEAGLVTLIMKKTSWYWTIPTLTKSHGDGPTARFIQNQSAIEWFWLHLIIFLLL